ncbi:hypothetical protein BDV93DRAFT_549515 [Ceratobasidium sp. AG-I]|nr:hypothetical protein BDV93DRAFT_549515 [Ceratobasidium sp. AG-I]
MPSTAPEFIDSKPPPDATSAKPNPLLIFLVLMFFTRPGVPYHLCGCTHSSTARKPANPVATLPKLFRGKGKDEAPAEFVSPSPQLVSTHKCESSDTHPLRHNSVLTTGQPVSESRRVEKMACQVGCADAGVFREGESFA